MAGRVRKELSLREVRTLKEACTHLAALAAMLHTRSWTGAPAALNLVQVCYEKIAYIYNRVECVLPAAEWLSPAQPAAQGPEISAPAASVDLAAAASQDAPKEP